MGQHVKSKKLQGTAKGLCWKGCVSCASKETFWLKEERGKLCLVQEKEIGKKKGKGRVWS